MTKTHQALLSVSALALLVVASPALASNVDVSGENAHTGANSVNNNTHDIDDRFNSDVDNNGNVDNTLDASANTGNNDQRRNTTGGGLDTGGVDASTDWESVLNAGAALMGAGDELDVMADFSNNVTGADSRNTNDLTIDNRANLDLNNTANVLNSLGLTANTGRNDQVRNTTAGDIDTGNVSASARSTNWANYNSGFASSNAGEAMVDVTGANGTTGADSRNVNTVTVDNRHNVTVNNRATVNNAVDVNANTGNNTQSRNTTGGGIDTGDVDVESDHVNVVNSGSAVAGSSSSLEVTADGSNDTTGADSRNVNTVDVDNRTNVDVNNRANVANTTDVQANTGRNEQSRNTEGGDISTGSVNISDTSYNEVNSTDL